MLEVIVIGGGVIGLTTAYELAIRRMRVTVVDRQQLGREASWAGAGILPPGCAGTRDDPMVRLCAESHSLWPALSKTLLEQTGVDNGFRECGGLCFSPGADGAGLQSEIADWTNAGVTAETLSDEALRRLEPAIGPAVGPAYRLPRTWQVRNPRHLKALLAACVRHNVRIVSGQPVTGFRKRGNRIESAQAADQCLAADVFVVTTGAWTSQLMRDVACSRRIEPVRGQMLLLSTPAPLVNHVLECGEQYIVPRPDGLTLVGSTEEWVGFEKRNTPAAIRNLTDFAIRMVPALAEARFETAWSGLRPQSVDGLPLLGRVRDTQNLYVAAGHFRSGLHLSPITARLMGQLIAGEPTDVPLEPFAPVRPTGVNHNVESRNR